MNDIKISNAGIIINNLRILSYFNDDRKLLSSISSIRKLFNSYQDVHVYLFNSIMECGRLINIELPEWVKGVTIEDKIFMISPEKWKNGHKEDFTELFLHEFIHSMINMTSKINCPVWLNEGLAQVLSNQRLEAAPAIFKISDISIYDLNYDTDNFYYISRDIVEKIINKYGAKFIINRMNYIDNYKEDKIFNDKNIKCLLLKRSE